MVNIRKAFKIIPYFKRKWNVLLEKWVGKEWVKTINYITTISILIILINALIPIIFSSFISEKEDLIKGIDNITTSSTIIIANYSITTSNDWIGYWGNIAGSIIGAVITIIALRKTIEFERKKEEENNRKSIIPLMAMETRIDDDIVKGNIELHMKCMDENNRKKEKKLGIIFENIGLGIALNIYFEGCILTIENSQGYSLIPMNQEISKNKISILKINEKMIGLIKLEYPRLKTELDRCIWEYSIRYEDIFENEYSQTIYIYMFINSENQECVDVKVDIPRILKEW